MIVFGSFLILIKLCIAIIVDFVFADPYNYPHPVKYIGKFIIFIENIMRKIFKNEKSLKFAGFITVIIIVCFSYLITFYSIKLIYSINNFFGFIFEIIIIWNCIALRCLDNEITKIYNSLRNNNIEKARKQISYLVSRDTEILDENGIIKATIETASENITDGIISPIFFIIIGGAPLGIAYKAINTIDSMIGYKNEKYINFGFFGAKIDDLANFIPARITGFLIVLYAFISNKDYKNSYRIMMRDNKKSKSPNAGWSESAIAGVLGIELCGETFYFGKKVYKDKIGDDINNINFEYIKDTIQFMYSSTFLLIIIYFLFVIYFKFLN